MRVEMRRVRLSVLHTVSDDLMHCGLEGERLARLLLDMPQQPDAGIDESPGAIGWLRTALPSRGIWIR